MLARLRFILNYVVEHLLKVINCDHEKYKDKSVNIAKTKISFRLILVNEVRKVINVKLIRNIVFYLIKICA